MPPDGLNVPSAQSTQNVVTSKWMQNGKFRARCRDCGFDRRTWTSPQAAVKRHVAETGHRVEVTRTMWKLVRWEDT